MALGSCSEHKEGIMVLLVKGGERLIMRPCNLAHSSHAFEDFCRAGAGKTPGSGGPRGAAPRSRPISRAQNCRYSAPQHPGSPKLRFKERMLGPAPVFVVVCIFFFLYAWVDWQL